MYVLTKPVEYDRIQSTLTYIVTIFQNSWVFAFMIKEKL